MRKSLLRLVGGLLAAAVLLVTIFVVNLIWFRPFKLDHFYEKVFISFMLDNPELLTMMGVAEQFGYRRHNAHLNDESVAKMDRDFAAWRQNLEDLKAYDPTRQSADQQLSTRVLAWFIESQLEGERFKLHNYPVNQLFGVQSQTPDFLINQHRIEDRRGADDFLARMGEIDRKFTQVQEGLELREQKGIVPPRFVIERVLVEMRAFASKPAAENPMCVHFASKVEALADVAAADKPALKARCPALVDQVVRPAYQRLITFFDGQRTRATTDDGVWKLPDGAAYYAYRVRRETTSNMTPQQVHDLGVAEVARIEAEMKAILAAQGQLQGDETPAQALTRLAKDPKFLYPNNEEGRQAALVEYKRMIDEQLVLTRAVIGLSPKAAIEVQRVPEFKEKTAPGAYYQGPALDGTRPGVFYANLRDMGALPKFGMRTLAIHEGVPGHHFQVALAQEQQGGPTFRKVLPFTAYMEGWALYAEWLGKEMGLYKDDPYGDLGRLQAEMFRAVRLVVDTGIHTQRWTRQQAIDYMVGKTGMAESEVVAEIERYIVDPGQALAYKVGMLSLRAARDRAQKALGAKWNTEAEKAFHDVILRGGALPLAIVDEQVDEWIKGRM
jgi:uncharacterized protein (DUF885 family)